MTTPRVIYLGPAYPCSDHSADPARAYAVGRDWSRGEALGSATVSEAETGQPGATVSEAEPASLKGT
jgi:hypothetical protein